MGGGRERVGHFEPRGEGREKGEAPEKKTRYRPFCVPLPPRMTAAKATVPSIPIHGGGDEGQKNEFRLYCGIMHALQCFMFGFFPLRWEYNSGRPNVDLAGRFFINFLL